MIKKRLYTASVAAVLITTGAGAGILDTQGEAKAKIDAPHQPRTAYMLMEVL